MRSIRFSLLVYFLGLVATALTVASLLVYRIAQRTLSDKEEAASKLIEAGYKERCEGARKRLDERLLGTAKSLAGRVRPFPRWDRMHIRTPSSDASLPQPLQGEFHFRGLGMLTMPAVPNGFVQAPLWVIQTVQFYNNYREAVPRTKRPRWPTLHPVQHYLWRHDLIELGMGQEVAVPEDGESPRIESLLQTNGWGQSLSYPAGGRLTLPDESAFASNARLTWVLDNYRLPNGVPVRRVRFRSLLTLQELPPGPMRAAYRAPPAAIIVQCAADSRELDAALAELQHQRDRERGTLRAETTALLVFQRNRLLLISGLTFAATILGCFGLVWLGLWPLRRLSDAVSKISPRNFTLPLGDKPMPVELRPIVERLTTTLDLLQRAFTREKQATADISHELRTPLAALLTTIELALRKQRSPEQYRELLDECLQSARHMNQIVERLLTLARLDAGVDRLRPQHVDVVALVEQCATVVRPLAEARGLQLKFATNFPPEMAGEGPEQMTTDPDKLREVLNNLLYNAIQYNRPAGRIDLMVSRENGTVQMEVRDTGIGIPTGVRERIFERFYRADPSRTGDGLNAGLGLAIVKEYVELMGGQVSVESEEGQGSTFRVQLPARGPQGMPAVESRFRAR